MSGPLPADERHLIVIDESDDVQEIIIQLVRGLRVPNPDDERDDQDGAS